MSKNDQDAFGPPAPGWPKVVGVISMVMAIIALACGVLGLGFMAVGESMFAGMMAGQLPDGVPPPPTMPPLDAIMLGVSAFGVVTNVLLIAAAVMLMRRRPAGRTLHLVYAVIAVVSAFLGTYASHRAQVQQQQAMTAWIADHGDTEFGKVIADSQQQQAAMQQSLQVGGLVATAVLSLAWPVFCIIWFGMVKRDAESIGPTEAAAA